MNSIIKVGAVSYLNTKPLIYGLEQSNLGTQIELELAYPAILAQKLKRGEVDIALMPVAAMKDIPNAYVAGKYGIASNGNVVSVAIFSHVPIEKIDTLLLDYQSRTSIALAQILVKQYWKIPMKFEPASEDYIAQIKDNKAGVIIGDRALEMLPHFPYVYDLSAAWKALTQLDFVFAAWIATKPLPESFLEEFNKANAIGLQHIEQVAMANQVPYYDIHTYYTQNIQYDLDEQKLKGMQHFLSLL